MKFIIFTVLLTVCIRAFAADSALPTFDHEQLTRVGAEIRQYQAEGRKIVLVLGDKPPEAYAPLSNHFKFDATNGFETEPYIVYFSDNTYSAKNFIHGDFNQTYVLSSRNSAFGSVFDLITVDHNVRKFMHSTEEQFRFFIGMLKNGGSMVFDNDPHQGAQILLTDAYNKIGGRPPSSCPIDEETYRGLSEEEKLKQALEIDSRLTTKQKSNKNPHDYAYWAQQPTIETLFCTHPYHSQTRYEAWNKELKYEHFIRITRL